MVRLPQLLFQFTQGGEGGIWRLDKSLAFQICDSQPLQDGGNTYLPQRNLPGDQRRFHAFKTTPPALQLDVWNLLKGLRERGVNLLAGVLQCRAGFQSQPQVPGSAVLCSRVCRDRQVDIRPSGAAPRQHPFHQEIQGCVLCQQVNIVTRFISKFPL